jgi:hypothetical protein
LKVGCRSSRCRLTLPRKMQVDLLLFALAEERAQTANG